MTHHGSGGAWALLIVPALENLAGEAAMRRTGLNLVGGSTCVASVPANRGGASRIRDGGCSGRGGWIWQIGRAHV